MKNYILLFLIGITLVSCSNDDDINNQNTSVRIIGNWNWVATYGGVANLTFTPESTGETRRLEISATTIKEYVNNELTSETNYTIELQESALNGQMKEMLISEQNSFRTVVEFIDNNLLLSGDYVDSVGSEYVRE